MNDKLVKRLRTEYPALFAPEGGRMPDISPYDGWFSIIRSWAKSITDFSQTSGNSLPVILQIKEKLGSLRIYTDQDAQEWVRRITGYAEAKSEHTCEFCGNSGKKRGGYWIKIRCEECQIRHEAEN